MRVCAPALCPLELSAYRTKAKKQQKKPTKNTKQKYQ